MASRARRGPDVDQGHGERRRLQDRDAVTCGVWWWAWEDLNLRLPPYQAYSRDAFKLVERTWRGHGGGDSDRGCPLGTVLDPPVRHVGGTNRKDYH
jgi:hypothetical protein